MDIIPTVLIGDCFTRCGHEVGEVILQGRVGQSDEILSELGLLISHLLQTLHVDLGALIAFDVTREISDTDEGPFVATRTSEVLRLGMMLVKFSTNNPTMGKRSKLTS